MLFKLKGTDATKLRFVGTDARCDRIGQELTEGEIIVDGDAGAYLGSKMRAGKIAVSGSAGALAGASMRGGTIDIARNAGERAGGVAVGEAHGMRGGRLSIGGKAGALLGERMRRGLIVGRGGAGDYAGGRMIAGTILLKGRVGRWAGYGLRRGSLILDKEPKELLADLRRLRHARFQLAPHARPAAQGDRRTLQGRLPREAADGRHGRARQGRDADPGVGPNFLDICVLSLPYGLCCCLSGSDRLSDMTATPFILLDDSLTATAPGASGRTLLFEDPERVIAVYRPKTWKPASTPSPTACRAGSTPRASSPTSLAIASSRSCNACCLGIGGSRSSGSASSASRARFNDAETRAWLDANGALERSTISDLQLSWTRDEYTERLRQRCRTTSPRATSIRSTSRCKYRFAFSGDPVALYAALRRKQRVEYGALIGAGDFHVLSLSPELFFRREGKHVTSRPMKGTAPRGRTPREDARLKTWLTVDEKQRAENLMIVDLLAQRSRPHRQDRLGRGHRPFHRRDLSHRASDDLRHHRRASEPTWGSRTC